MKTFKFPHQPTFRFSRHKFISSRSFFSASDISEQIKLFRILLFRCSCVALVVALVVSLCCKHARNHCGILLYQLWENHRILFGNFSINALGRVTPISKVSTLAHFLSLFHTFKYTDQDNAEKWGNGPYLR